MGLLDRIYRKILAQSVNVESIYNDWPVVYIWKAISYSTLRQFDNAYESISAGLQNCTDKANLCSKMGDIKFFQSKVEAFGWFMQACMLAYNDLNPFLYLSVASAELGMSTLYLRLLNACDIWWHFAIQQSMPRFPQEKEKTIRQLSQRDRQPLLIALRSFEKYMEPFLPAPDLLPSPENDLERDIEVHSFAGIGPNLDDVKNPVMQEWRRFQSISRKGKGFQQ